jgi:hypothetical protein
MNEVQNNEFELIITEKNLGSLTTNAKAIRDKIKEILPKYSAENYSENNIENAKSDKAMLNNTAKKLNDKRIELEKEFLKPFDEFKATVKETTDMIKEASSKIDLIVKEVDLKAKQERRNYIENLFNSIVGELKELVTLDMIFDEKWLNKGSFNDKGEFKLSSELENKLNKIRNDLETIKTLKSSYEVSLTNQYLRTFDLGSVIQENNRLNELAEKTKQIEVVKEEIVKEKVEEMVSKPVEVEEFDPIKTEKIAITGTLSQRRKLKEFLDLNKMKYERIED